STTQSSSLSYDAEQAQTEEGRTLCTPRSSSASTTGNTANPSILATPAPTAGTATEEATEGIAEGDNDTRQQLDSPHSPSSQPSATSSNFNAPPPPLLIPPSSLLNDPPSTPPPALPSHTTTPASLPSPPSSPLHSSLPPPSPHASSPSRSSHPSPSPSSFPPSSPSPAASTSPAVSAATAIRAAASNTGGVGGRGAGASPEASTEASTGCMGWERGSAADSISPVGSARSIGWDAGGRITAPGNVSPAGSMGSMRSVGWEGEPMSPAWSGEAGQAWVGERPVWEIKLRDVVLKREIAKGSSGTVYKGKYKDSTVAVRIVPWSEVEGEMSEGEQWEHKRAKFLREVTIWRRLKHPNIVKFLGASIPEHPQLLTTPTSAAREKGADTRFKGHAFCGVMEHVEHCSLKEYLFRAARERRKLPMPFIVQVAVDLGKGLAYMHSMGVVHGDICPENLLLDGKRRLKIARFGAARVESSHPVSTATGSCRRTLSYSAPEVLFSQPYDRSADVYSFGICLWELYAREAPFPNLDFGEVADAVKEGARPIISPMCPPDLANVMRCCWEGIPPARPSMPQVLAMLKVGRGGQADSGEAGGAGARRRRSESSRGVGVNIAALDKALDRVMSMPWRGEKKAGDCDGGLGLGAAWQEKGGKNGKHVLGRARSHGNGEGSSVLAAAAAAVAAIRSDGDTVAFPNNVTGVPLNKCGTEAGAKDATNKERCAEVELGTDGGRGEGDAAVASDPSWQVDLRRVTIKKEIFKGAYSTVYKGAFRDMDVAVKAIDWGEAGSFSPVLRAKQRAALLRQVHVWRGLKHPYVTQVSVVHVRVARLVAASVAADRAPCTTPRGVDARLRGVAGCLIMEYAGDLTLKEYLARAARERRKLPLHMVVELALQLAKGLAYIHSSGVVHGDVCPDNLLLTDRRRLKIAGFGVARFEAHCKARGRAGAQWGGGPGSAGVNEDSGKRAAVAAMGYMAPEVLAGLPYDRRADVYSFGICLWELLTCETPFDSFDFSEMASAISEGVRPILPHKCPLDIARVMRCCWEGSSAARPSMPQVIAMLDKVNVFSGREIPVHNI
ncbi:unnamed protein product, partial [Closterium sp. Yama58-4]